MTTLSPDLRLRRLANAYQLSRAVQVAARLGLGQLLTEGPRSARDLANATATVEHILLRLLRFLAELQVVEELPDNTFGPTPLSDLLHRVDNIAQGEEAWSTWDALPRALCTGRAAFPDVHGTSFYEYAAAHPDLEANWRETNAAIAKDLAPSIAESLHIEEGETIVDVGGGQGVLLAYLLKENPRCRGILLDLPGAVSGAREILAAAGASERCEVRPGNAFEGLPQSGDLYLLSRVLFNWNDEKALALLKRCRQAMSPTARLLVVEVLMPVDGEPRGQGLAAADLHHFLLWGSRYRTADEFEALLRRAGLALTGVRAAGGGSWTTLEARIDPMPRG